MAPSCRSRIIVVAMLSLACANPPTSPTGPRLPVIEGTLVADSLDHVFTLSWSVFRVGEDRRKPDPVEAVDVALTLHLPDGGRAELEPVADEPGRFVARAQVRPFEAFRLTGTVAGFPIDATTRVPGPLAVTLPDTDTTVILSSGHVFRRFPFSWQAARAGGYFAWPRIIGFESTLTSGEIFFPSFPDTVAVTILAVDSASAAFYRAGFFNPPRGNIPGVLGVFGAATSVRRVFIWVGPE